MTKLVNLDSLSEEDLEQLRGNISENWNRNPNLEQ